MLNTTDGEGRQVPTETIPEGFYCRRPVRQAIRESEKRTTWKRNTTGGLRQTARSTEEDEDDTERRLPEKIGGRFCFFALISRPPMSVSCFRLVLLPVLCVGLLVVTACDSGGNNNNDDGDHSSSLDNSFSLTVTDDNTGNTSTLEGFSYFATGTDPDTGVEGFVMYFVDDENFVESDAQDGLFGIAARLGGLPSGGQQYSVTEDDATVEAGDSFAMVLYENFGAQSGTVYAVTGGSVNVGSASASQVDGELDVQALSASFDGSGATEQPVTITGRFQAPGVNSVFGTNFLQ